MKKKNPLTEVLDIVIDHLDSALSREVGLDGV